jgi:hypothetical protein
MLPIPERDQFAPTEPPPEPEPPFSNPDWDEWEYRYEAMRMTAVVDVY